MTAVARAVVALALVAAPVAAQAPGLPVHGGGFRNGLEVVATVGWAGESSQTGKATTFGGTLAYGWSRVGVAGTLAVLSAETTGDHPAGGLLASFRALGNGVDTPFELSLFGGYGVTPGWGEDAIVGGPPTYEHWRVPFGAALSAAITTPIVSVRPWVAPRAELLKYGGESTPKFAASAGVDLRFPGGLGLRALWESVHDQDQTLGVGLAYRF